MIFYFIRHGETDWNVRKKIQGKADIPLNENGLNQAKALADELAELKPDVVRAYTSPQQRAKLTAGIAAEALGVECVSLDGLREMDLGEWEGSNWDIIEQTYGEVYHYWNSHRRYTHTPGGECYNEVLERALESLGIILEREQGDVLVVTHSAILMVLRCYLARLPFEEMLRFRTKNAAWFTVSAEEMKDALTRFAAGY